MRNIMIISGSPAQISRTDIVLQYVKSYLEKEGFSVSFLSVQDVSADDLIHGRYDSPAIKKLSEEIKRADGVIIGSPVYKASFTGVLKALIDLFPEGILKDIPVFPLMVGGSMSHLLALEFSLKPLITNLKGNPTQGIYILDKNIDKTNVLLPITDVETHYRLSNNIDEFMDAINRRIEYSV
jgi:FMN reductase